LEKNGKFDFGANLQRSSNFFPEFSLVSARLPHQPKADFQNKKFSFNCFKKNRAPLQKGNGKFFGFELR